MSGETSEDRSVLRWIAVGIVVVMAVQIIYWLVLRHLVPLPNNRGLFGDAFGGLNTLFTGLVVPGALIAIYMQMRDARESRKDQEDTLKAMQGQVALLEAQLKRQMLRDKVQAGPFFRLDGNVITSLRLDLKLTNVGAPVICLDFRCTSAGNTVQFWHPSALSDGTVFQAPTNLLGSSPLELEYRMRLRDRWGEVRYFNLTLRNLRTGPVILDFEERDGELPSGDSESSSAIGPGRSERSHAASGSAP